MAALMTNDIFDMPLRLLFETVLASSELLVNDPQ